MMRAGISMQAADETELGMYLKVLAQAAKHDESPVEDDAQLRQTPQGKKNVVELKRGYIDEFWG